MFMLLVNDFILSCRLGLGRPPISYKRQIEDDDDDDEYDSEMDDFIEDEGEPQEEISKHIREIFGYDRKR